MLTRGTRRLFLVLFGLLLVLVTSVVSLTTAAAAPYSTAPTLSIQDPCVGQTNLVQGVDFTPGERVTLTLTGAQNPIGSVVVDADGRFTLVIIYPETLLGPHHLQATGSAGDTAGTDVDIHSCAPRPTATASVTLSVSAAETVSSNAPTTQPTTAPSTTSTAAVVVTTTLITGTAAAGANGGLPNTGVAVVGILVVGLLLLISGLIVLRLSRRGRVH